MESNHKGQLKMVPSIVPNYREWTKVPVSSIWRQLQVCGGIQQKWLTVPASLVPAIFPPPFGGLTC